MPRSPSALVKSVANSDEVRRSVFLYWVVSYWSASVRHRRDIVEIVFVDHRAANQIRSVLEDAAGVEDDGAKARVARDLQHAASAIDGSR
jgi:hypothetical protein